MVAAITVVGIGPGSPDYIIPAARRAIADSDVVVGGKRALDTLVEGPQKRVFITADLAALEREIRAVPPTQKITVLVSGDPGYYSLLQWLRRTFPEENIEVIPGLSSIQVAFSRIAESWYDATLLSFHGRVPEEKELVYQKGKKLAFLTDAQHNPAYIAQVLLAHGWPAESRAVAMERISYEDEKRLDTTLDACAQSEGFFHSVLVVMG